MNFYHADYELAVANRRIEDMRLEIANNRIRPAAPSSGSSASVLALIDAAVARASQGAVRRHSARNERRRPA